MLDYAEIGAFEWGMLIVALVAFCLFLHIYNKTPRIRETPRSFRAVLAVFSTWAVLYGGSKPQQGRVTVDDPYIRDAGSYLTNDVAHVSVAKKTALLPDATEILVYARELEQTNATDWVRLSPHRNSYAKSTKTGGPLAEKRMNVQQKITEVYKWTQSNS